MHITIEFFGLFKQYGNHLELDLPHQSIVSDIRPYLAENLNIPLEKLDSVRFASESSILSEEAELQEGMKLAILPPISGG